MARARNIKPGFFKNELLIELGAFDRLLFVGLWCLADREGRIEDRPKRIKLELFPCDTYDVDSGLNELARCGFIKRYEINGIRVVLISNFLKHQTPHGTEKDSELPDENGCLTQHVRVNGYVTGIKRANNVKSGSNNRQSPLDTGARTVIAPLDNTLNPESLFTDSLNPDSFVTQDKPAKTAKRKTQIDDDFYPNETGLETAHKAGVDVCTELEAFLNHHKAKGSAMADWQAAWRTWVAKSVKFAKSRRPAESFKERDERNARKRWEEMTGQVHPDNMTFVDQPSLMLGVAA